MIDSLAPGPSGSSLYESTSNELEISSDESLCSNEEESSIIVLAVFQLTSVKLYPY